MFPWEVAIRVAGLSEPYDEVSWSLSCVGHFIGLHRHAEWARVAREDRQMAIEDNMSHIQRDREYRDDGSEFDSRFRFWLL